ncbi:UPF0721 transmembrane protein [Aliidongia dinghuensis]|uniref:Probable membrane transporter protein n=1 Tax=Aliidongia dinghuensis TaxID=1867774 RepID=A0A8J2YWW0_9PROT|nr:TSUP family transporter [Aliidongia dinghuensis]GGF33713.1 UPF0721 transmembrane protein [Aliidongia dinghuensis]
MDIPAHLDQVGLLFTASSLAGFIDAIAGGGGLITLPALLLMPIAPIQALATNKLQGSFGTLTASLTMLRRGVVTVAEVRLLFVASLLGSTLGAVLLLLIDPKSLDLLVPVVLVGVALYFLLSPRTGDGGRPPRVGTTVYRLLVVPGIGFYDGMFGPGSGSLFSASGVFLRGQSLLRATATAKVLNFAANLASLVVFVLGDQVQWGVGVVMIVGNMLGARLGALAAIGGGARLIRPMIVLICLAMLVRYAWQNGLV